MDIKTRIAAAADLPAICSMLAVQLKEHRVSTNPERLHSAAAAVIDQPQLGFLIVALLNGRFAGVAYVSAIWALEHQGLSGWLEELYVAPELRGHGVGSALVQAVAAESSARGFSAVDLEIDAEHERVRSLYSRLGFSPLPRSRLVKIL